MSRDEQITPDDIRDAILSGYPVSEREPRTRDCNLAFIDRALMDEIRQALILARESCKSPTVRDTIGNVLSKLERAVYE